MLVAAQRNAGVEFSEEVARKVLSPKAVILTVFMFFYQEYMQLYTLMERQTEKIVNYMQKR